MCVVSMVHDHFDQVIPWVQPARYEPSRTSDPLTLPNVFTVEQIPAAYVEDLKRLIEEFRSLVEAAKRIDAATGQPDCLDSEKAKLTGRVAELEALLANPFDFVVKRKSVLEPGRYRVIDGRIYRCVDEESSTP